MNQYLEKIALNRITKEILKSPGKFHTESLVSAGALRSKERFENAVDTANNTLQKHIENKGVSVDRSHAKSMKEKIPALSTGGYYTAPSWNGKHVNIVGSKPAGPIESLISPIHSIRHTEGTRNFVDQLAMRHELHEASELTNKTVVDRLNTHGTRTGTFVNHSGKASGNHFSPAVLGNESNDLTKFYSNNSLAKNPHGQGFAKKVEKDWGSAKSHFVKLRTGTGEAEALKGISGKSYGSSHFTESDLQGLRTAKPTAKVLLNGVTPTLAHAPSGVSANKASTRTDKSINFQKRLAGFMDNHKKVFGGLGNQLSQHISGYGPGFDPSKY